MATTKDVVEFGSIRGPHGFFSNFYKDPVVYDGIVWPTSEAAFQGAKNHCEAYKDQVQRASSPSRAKALGRKTCLREDWEKPHPCYPRLRVKDVIMLGIVKARFEQQPRFRDALLATGRCTIVERTNRDSYWGDGRNRNGKNMLGKILMAVRARRL